MFLLFILEIHLKPFPSGTSMLVLNILFPIRWSPWCSSHIPTGTDDMVIEVIPVFYIQLVFARITFLGERVVLELSLLVPCDHFTGQNDTSKTRVTTVAETEVLAFSTDFFALPYTIMAHFPNRYLAVRF